MDAKSRHSLEFGPLSFFQSIWFTILKLLDGFREWQWGIRRGIGGRLEKSGPANIYRKTRLAISDRLTSLDSTRRFRFESIRYVYQVGVLDTIAKIKDMFALKASKATDGVMESSAMGRVYRLTDYLGSAAYACLRSLGRLFRFAAFCISFLWMKLEERLANSAYFSWLAVCLRLPREIVGSSVEFFWAWHESRQYIRLILAIPAFMLSLPIAYYLIRIPLRSEIALASQYQKAASRAWEDEDYEAAKLFYRKISQLGVLQESTAYETAALAYEQGNRDEAFQQMTEIVQAHQSPQAKLWLADKLMSENIGFKDKATRIETAAKYIDDLTNFAPDNPAIMHAHALLEFHQNKHDSAIETLRSIADRFPGAHNTIAMIEQARGNSAAARKAREEASGLFMKSDYLSWQDYVHWARARLASGDWDGMMSTVDKGVNSYADNKQFQQAVIQLHQVAFDFLRQRNFDVPMQLKILEHALSIHSQEVGLLDRLALLAANNDVSQKVSDLFNKHSSDEQLPDNVHFLLGRSAYIRKDFNEARKRLDYFVKRNPDDAAALNNLAWLLANTDARDLQRAADLSKKSVELAPDAARYRETLGQIKIQLQEWEEAVVELKIALNAYPHKTEIHTSLAKAFRELGESELSQMHTSAAESID